ncbi:MAG: hypothetical protein ACQKBU_08465 [Verrucomicrobiales bacterium]
MSLLKCWGVTVGFALAMASCDDPAPRPKEPIVPDPLQEVSRILTGDPDPEKKPLKPTVDERGKPVIPTAEPVPNKPGFVISPYNGKWIDVTGLPVGEPVADPHFPSEEKKYFRVPAPLSDGEVHENAKETPLDAILTGEEVDLSE